jgi:hypothetical protein
MNQCGFPSLKHILWVWIPLVMIGLVTLMGIVAVYGSPSLGYVFQFDRVFKHFPAIPARNTIWEPNQTVLKQEAIHYPTDAMKIIAGYKIDPQIDAPDEIILTGNPFGSNIERVESQTLPLEPHLRSYTYTKFGVSFIHREHGFVDYVFDEPVELPLWTKTLDFWTYGMDNQTDLIFYISIGTGLKQKYHFRAANPQEWTRQTVHLFHTNQYRNTLPIRLHRIRVAVELGSEVPDYFEIYISDPYAHNYLKPPAIKDLETQYILQDFETPLQNQWEIRTYKPKIIPNVEFWQEWMDGEHLRFNQRIADRVIYEIVPDSTDFSIEARENEFENRYWNVKMNREAIAQRPFYVVFWSPYRIYRNYVLSLNILGESDRTEVVAILEDGHQRLFELSLGYVAFTGWKKLMVSLPEEEIFFFRDAVTDKEFIKVRGLKFAPGNAQEQGISLGVDLLATVYDYHNVLP